MDAPAYCDLPGRGIVESAPEFNSVPVDLGLNCAEPEAATTDPADCELGYGDRRDKPCMFVVGVCTGSPSNRDADWFGMIIGSTTLPLRKGTKLEDPLQSRGIGSRAWFPFAT